MRKLKTVIFSLLIFNFNVLISLKFVFVCINSNMSYLLVVDSAFQHVNFT